MHKNKYAVVPLVILSRAWPYDEHYKAGANATMQVLQDWVGGQVGRTFRLLPAKEIFSWKTAEEHKAGNIYHDIRGQLDAQPKYDSSGQRIQFCNWRRLYVLFATGDCNLANMAGRQSWECAPQPLNPLDPWGPGVAGGPSDWAMELMAGHPVENPPQTLDGSRGATLHEMLHCIGIQHPDEGADGAEAWLSPMAGWWFFGKGDDNGNPAALLPREIAELRGETKGAGPNGTSPKPGSHFLS